MRHQLARAGDPARTAEAGVIDQVAGFLGDQLVKRQCSARAIGGDVLANFPSVLSRRLRPDQFHAAAPAILRRVSARQISASASTSSDEISSPALAESKPICT